MSKVSTYPYVNLQHPWQSQSIHGAMESFHKTMLNLKMQIISSACIFYEIETPILNRYCTGFDLLKICDIFLLLKMLMKIIEGILLCTRYVDKYNTCACESYVATSDSAQHSKWPTSRFLVCYFPIIRSLTNIQIVFTC